MNKKSQIKEKGLFPFLSLKTSLDIIGAPFGNFWLSKGAQFSGFCAPFGNFLCPFWKLPLSKRAQEIAEKGIGNCRKGHRRQCEKRPEIGRNCRKGHRKLPKRAQKESRHFSNSRKIAEKGIGNCRKGHRGRQIKRTGNLSPVPIRGSWNHVPCTPVGSHRTQPERAARRPSLRRGSGQRAFRGRHEVCSC